MKVKILKGTKQIGGCITEITSEKGTRIIIDFGEDLPDEEEIKNEKLSVEGLTKDSDKKLYDAVFITHSHSDHIGLIGDIRDDIPIYVEKYSKIINDLTCDFTNHALVTRDIINFDFNKPVKIKDIVVTPYLIDHSAFNSCMFLIEADGKRIVHTGDYRNHGRKGKIFDKTLKEIGQVDCLITEGTTFSRPKEKYKTEDALCIEAVKLFEKYDDVLVLQSSTNIDRIVTFYKAARKTKKKFVEDLFTAWITSSLPESIPSPTHNFCDLSVWISKNNENRKNPPYFIEKYVEPMVKYKRCEHFKDNVCLLVKQSMLKDIKMLKTEKHKFKNACLIYSMWDGYLEKDDMKKFIEEVKKLGIKFEYLHTSGHADESAMKRVRDILKPKITIPIHTDNKEVAKDIFGDSVIEIEDGESINI